jgi:hypothetical protein
MSDWRVCFCTPMEHEAHIVKGFLEHYGVPCVSENQNFRMEPLTFFAMGEIRLLVPDEWSRVARGLIAGRTGKQDAANDRGEGEGDG